MNEELKKFIWNVSHDLRTPIRTISICSDMVKENIRDTADADSLAFLDKITAASLGMEALVGDLLEYMELVEKKVSGASINLNDIVGDALYYQSEEIQNSNAKVTVNDLPMAFANASRARRVFINIIGNALKYREKGIPPILDISSVSNTGGEGNMVEVHIKDNGIGLDEQYLEKMLSPFGRLVTQDEYPGSGLGLTVVKQILDDSGGSIAVKSQEGVGSTFIVSLPVK